MNLPNPSNARKVALALPALLLLGLAACSTTVRQATDFAARADQIRDVGVLPPEAEFRLIVLRGNDQSLDDEARRIRDALPAAIQKELSERGFSTRPVRDGTTGVRPVSDSMRFELTQAQETVRAALEEMYASPTLGKAEALAYERSLGPAMSTLADNLDVDGLLFVSYSGYRRSGGEAAKSALLSLLYVFTGIGGSLDTTGATLSACLVDGRKGDVLWANQLTVKGVFLPGLEDYVEALFDPLER